MKKWNKPKLLVLKSQSINSGGQNQVKPGEFIALINGTSCPFYYDSCIPQGSYVVYESGPESPYVFCQTDNAGYLAFPVCS